MKPRLEDLLDTPLENLGETLNAIAQNNLHDAFDSAVILAKNVRRQGVRMPLIVDFISAQFDGIEKGAVADSAEFSALSVVGDYRAGQDGIRQRAAEIFEKRLNALRHLDEKQAKSVALNVKSFAYDDNPVRGVALRFLIGASDFEELSDLARNAHHFTEEEQLIFLGRVDSFTEQFPGGVKAIMDGFINRVGVSLGPAGQKAEEIFERSKNMAGPVFALIGADDENMTYVYEDDDKPDVIVPLDRTLN